MKELTKLVIVGAIGTAIGFYTFKATKQKQQNAIEARQHVPYGVYEAFLKRPLDIILSGIAFIVLSPVFVITALLVKIKLGSPVIFKQERPGRIDPVTGKERIFTLYKFRTMSEQKNPDGKLLLDEERLTDFGKRLRSTSLDELPELLNIIRGDMSIVGPRPLLVKYLSLYNEEQHHRHDVRPGLTGWAQVSGRNCVSWEKRFQDDMEYINSITLFNDWKIILKTVFWVLKKEGITSETSITMEEFEGTQK